METVLDLDKLSEAEEGKSFGRRSALSACDRCLVFLSRGGADAEWFANLISRAKPSPGRLLPADEEDVSWRNQDVLVGLISTGSLTGSGYPRIVKEWKRERRWQRPRHFRRKSDDVSVDASVVHDHGRTYNEFIQRGVTFFTSQTYVQRGAEW